jgi:hypothetical protein
MRISALFLGLVLFSLRANAAAVFGTTDYIVVPDAASLTPSTNSITIEVWVKLNNLPSGTAKTIVSKRISLANNDEYLLATFTGESGCVGGSSEDGFIFRVNGITGFACNNTGITADTLLHVVATYDGATAVLYVNGVPGNTRNSNAPISNGTANLCIGCLAAASGSSPFDGTIYMVGIYNRPMSSQEVLSRFNSRTLAVPDSSTMGLWYLDEGIPNQQMTGGRFYDRSRNRNNGTANIGSNTALIAAQNELRYPGD